MSILVVDDSSTARMIVAKILQKFEYRSILEAGSVSSALSQICSHSISLVISDLRMNDGEGLDILRWLRSREETVTTPFIMMTVDHNPRFIVEAAHLGIDAYLMKPINAHLLAEKMTALHSSRGFQAPVISSDHHV